MSHTGITVIVLLSLLGLVASLQVLPAVPVLALLLLQNLRTVQGSPAHALGAPAVHHQAVPMLQEMIRRRKAEVVVIHHRPDRDLVCL